MRFVIWSEVLGVYLGGGRWSKIDGKGVRLAPTFGEEKAKDVLKDLPTVMACTMRGVWATGEDDQATPDDVHNIGLFW